MDSATDQRRARQGSYHGFFMTKAVKRPPVLRYILRSLPEGKMSEAIHDMRTLYLDIAVLHG